MPWTALDDHFDDNEDMDHISDSAVCLFVCMMTWCSRHLSDGKISEKSARKLKGFSKKSIDELCSLDKPWIERIEDGFLLPSFLSYNPSREEIEAKRAETRERVRGFREKKKQVCNTVTDNVTPSVTNGVSNSSSPTPTPNTTSSLRSEVVNAHEETDQDPAFSETVKAQADRWISHLMQNQTRYRQVTPSERLAILQWLSDPDHGDPEKAVTFSMSIPNNRMLKCEFGKQSASKRSIQDARQEIGEALGVPIR